MDARTSLSRYFTRGGYACLAFAGMLMASCGAGEKPVSKHSADSAVTAESVQVAGVPRHPNAPSMPKASCCKGAPSRVRALAAKK
ncbi:hypothetical protein [Hufsiella ginkgonis]|uniref:Uncharacterized protein n=1 Tax=Hufsiella ginkgonis TaxID=2695274 RepID=A0A7K1XRZ9_9SPHI|nr:hypothetical protein [Hufsiella ginkgonis]MXV13763.1 hypothetical protein [Hufsiella ginkgonis]